MVTPVMTTMNPVRTNTCHDGPPGGSTSVITLVETCVTASAPGTSHTGTRARNPTWMPSTYSGATNSGATSWVGLSTTARTAAHRSAHATGPVPDCPSAMTPYRPARGRP